ncbi:MAG: hypothetical protein JXD18_02885 [Anaerolineae bacterium]|nr:hypothetical protein [Anaerolineae bacterium]
MWDFLFVSDLHLALGYDSRRHAYHAREDFFFDEAFFRWLRWADASCAPGRRWELTFVGDTFDFLPVDETVVAQYVRALDRRRAAIDPSDPQAVVRYWQRQFGTPESPVAIQRLLFENDVREGKVALAPAPPVAKAATAAPPTVPDWAAEVYTQHAEPHLSAVPLTLTTPAEAQAALLTTKAALPSPKDVPERPQPREDAFERTYGFLPTPEKSASKVASIHAGHPVFFQALAWFVGQGHRIVFVRGNHDLELFWPSVQERLRQAIAQSCDGPPPADLQTRIDFSPGWFHYRPGVFYAEHGKQYELMNACANPIRPTLPGQSRRLNPPVGSLFVTCFHNHLEDAFPEWENEGEHAVVILDLLRRYPLKMAAMLIGHGVDFLHMSQQLWQAGRRKNQTPTEHDFAQQAKTSGLDPQTVKAIYDESDPPLLTRRALAWFFFSPWGHVLKLLLLLALTGAVLGLGLLWYLLAAPALAGLIPLATGAGPALQLLAKIVLWLLPPVAFEAVRRCMQKRHPEPFLCAAAARIHRHLHPHDPHIRFYVFGHDHKPDVRIVEQPEAGGPVYYVNTGSWIPWFAEGKRRLQTLGQEVQFTFARLVEGENGYALDLLRWNDDAGRADRQFTPPV